MRLALLVLALGLLGAAAWAEPRTLYSEIYASLRGAESDLGRIEMKVDKVREPTRDDWEETTRALVRLDEVWKSCQARLDEVEAPKHEKYWARMQAMLASQRELGLKSGYAVQLRYQLWDPAGPPPGVSKATLEAVRKELPALRARYSKASAEASQNL